ncbi:MAG: phosphatidate cytidylyltransferase [Nevskia sp.]|nr:phosphatidate cytidylyltransferase [Nevskia sp.]
MLLQRVITALVLLPIVLGAIWFAPTPWLYALFSGAALLAAWEWTAMMGLPQTAEAACRRWGYVLLSAVVLAAAWLARAAWPWFAALGVLWWLCALSLMPGFPGNLQRHKPGVPALGLLGQVLWVPAIISLAVIGGMQEHGLRLIYLFALVWAADVGAYLAGRNFGRNKLAPNVSPGKTREGALGGLLLCAVYAVAAGGYVFQPAGLRQLLLLVGLSLLVAALSIVGDLGISMFKRLSGIKDSGKLLPGHGGILDRIDSLLAAGPAMALGLYWLQL